VVDDVAAELAEAIELALPGWVERSVLRVLAAHRMPTTGKVAAAANDAGRQALAELGPEIRRLLERDIDDQQSTPLAMLRTAVRYPTAVLRAAGVPPAQRDEYQALAFPDDVYDLTPASFAEVDETLADPGIRWGAHKAMTHLRRRREPGR
jgi:hypothetical protein